MAGRTSPQTFHGAVALTMSLLLTVTVMFLFSLRVEWAPLLACWLVSVNVVAFGYYGYDKARAKGSRTRVPESVLHAIALAGGTLGAYLGMRVFRHKTIKGSFRVLFWVIAVLQVLLVVAALYRMWKKPEEAKEARLTVPVVGRMDATPVRGGRPI
jgi:uncharacterized membrane protein YsdA (DUF1294 family)